MYVSDILDAIFPSIRATRTIFGEEIRAIGNELPAHLQSVIAERLRYYSTKCMGFPAVWCTGHFLAIPDEEIINIVRSNPTATYISLSTSVMDDLIDKESKSPKKDVIVFYLLIYSALAKNGWNEGGLGKFIFKESVNATAAFMAGNETNSPLSQKTELTNGLSRIGSFHKMIAYDLTSGLPLTPEKKRSCIALAGKLGNWCAALDDFLDFTLDYRNEETHSFAHKLIAQKYPHLGPSIHQFSETVLQSYSENYAFAQTIIDELIRMLQEIATEARSEYSTAFAEELDGGASALKAILTHQYFLDFNDNTKSNEFNFTSPL